MIFYTQQRRDCKNDLICVLNVLGEVVTRLQDAVYLLA